MKDSLSYEGLHAVMAKARRVTSYNSSQNTVEGFLPVRLKLFGGLGAKKSNRSPLLGENT